MWEGYVLSFRLTIEDTHALVAGKMPSMPNGLQIVLHPALPSQR